MPMTPQERIRAAKESFQRAKSQPGLPDSLRVELRRVANNLVALNLLQQSQGQVSARTAVPSMARDPSIPR